MRALHTLDIAIVAGYFGALLFFGRRSSQRIRNEESFFLAGRRLSKLYQFFLNFGNSTDANTAVSTVSLVYRHGIAGIWLSLHMIFINPYYWFMSLWFRRVRLITMADLFQDRFGGQRLARLYALFQIGVGIVLIGFGNFTAYKITAAFAPGLAPLTFYLVYVSLIGAYLVMGGMAGTALSEAFQGTLIVAFSAMLVPAGIARLGGWGALHTHVAAPAFALFGTGRESPFTSSSVLAILFVSVIQINANLGNMSVHGSARNEAAARFGAVSGTYGKRLMIMLWGFVGLIALGLFRGPEQLADPDAAWGMLSRQLFGPGLLGLMLAGTFAASTSAIAVKSLAVSALFTRNLYAGFSAGGSGRSGVAAGRLGIVAVLAASIAAALAMENVVEVMKFILTINLSFGAAVLLLFFWRRLTAPAVWWCVLLSILTMVVIPYGARWLPVPPTASAYFDAAGSPDSAHPGSPPARRGRFNFEAWALSRVGPDLAKASASQRLTLQMLCDGIFPFAVLIVASLLTRPPPRELTDQFFGKMKTPVGATPELEAAAVAATLRDPLRFDHRKLFPGTAWEFTRWDRIDLLGFTACCGVTATLIAAFWLCLRLLA